MRKPFGLTLSVGVNHTKKFVAHLYIRYAYITLHPYERLFSIWGYQSKETPPNQNEHHESDSSKWAVLKPVSFLLIHMHIYIYIYECMYVYSDLPALVRVPN